jgi:3-dehydroquinate synthase
MADYKNMIGTFTHPEFVILDVDMLRTLPLRELRAGMAEVVKAAIIGDKELFEELERCDINTLLNDRLAMERIVARALRVKISIVECDEREAGLRRLLNLGHTVGHAIEKCSHNYNHGEAVAIGMVVVAKASVKKEVINVVVARRIEELLERLGFVLNINLSKEEIIEHIALDKKRNGDLINLVMPVDIGKCEVVAMSFEELRTIL